jgi:hypothetical protein
MTWLFRICEVHDRKTLLGSLRDVQVLLAAVLLQDQFAHRGPRQGQVPDNRRRLQGGLGDSMFRTGARRHGRDAREKHRHSGRVFFCD